MLIRLLLALLIVIALTVLYFFITLNWSYSIGERAGWVQKLSKKGWVCKTWEGELALVSLPGSAVEKFYFTVHDDETATKITRLVGKRVSLHYEEKVGLPTTCFGETRHFVTGVMEAPDIPIGPGVVVPNPSAQAAPAASDAASSALPSTAAPALPAVVPASAPAAAPPAMAPAASPTPAPMPAPAAVPSPQPGAASPAPAAAASR